ncbi:MAG: hypothetical protein ALECFALPRED_000320 [Alectoria fallacina]|uniref:Uncharacterized protein n=1 Tax=Alectoria fallacina TaxID=1903189 RepID=A0A8H3JA24_9LECA|nr:MAG: hypothetical protein ALECFALPRED_000320 [Alectoria fallacina]
MSFNPQEPTFRSRPTAPPRFQLTAHTEGATALAENVFHGRINQNEYDGQTYSTTIVSTSRATSVPITLNLDDSLATLKAYAHDKFEVPLAKAEGTRLYVFWSTKIFYAIGVHAVPENSELLDQDTLKMILTFMKASTQVEQLLVQFGEDEVEVATVSERTALEMYRAGAEAQDTTPARKVEPSSLTKYERSR